MRDTKRPIAEHFNELRWRLSIVVLGVLIGAGVSVAFFRQLVAVLIRPAEDHLSVTGGPVFTEVTELLGVTVKVAILGGLVLALPLLIYQIMRFVAPGLTRKEFRYALLILPGSLVSFAAGVSFAYFILLPPILVFLLTFGGDIAVPMIRIGNYINLVVTLLFWMGVVFETPLIMFTLAKVGIIQANTFAKGRRLAVVVAFLLGAIITPTFDPVNQTLVALPLIFLYEIGIWMAKLARR